MDNLFILSETQVSTCYIVKDYNGMKRHMVFKSPIKKRGYEEVNKKIQDVGLKNISDEESIIENRKRARIRARERVKAITLMNKWTYFVTLTFDKEKVDRYDKEEVLKKTLLWLRKQYKKNGIKYLLVAEYHKDKAIHWHGLIYDPNNSLKLSKADLKTDTDREVFNIDSWSNFKGFNTAVKLDNNLVSVGSYISKYITKENDKVFDKYYYCSNGLINEPNISYPTKIPKEYQEWYENEFCYIYDEVIKEEE